MRKTGNFEDIARFFLCLLKLVRYTKNIMKGNVIVIIGGQYGSEAKGKVISFLANEFDIAVRTGSPNAGHTVFKGDEVFRLQQIPATFLNEKCILCIGAGGLINPNVLRNEVEITKTRGRLFIDQQAGIIEEKHLSEEGELVEKIGSTGKGCGAALSARIWRKDFTLAKDVLKDFQLDDVARIINQGIDNGKNILCPAQK